MTATVLASEALANAIARGTAHHAHNGDRTVAFRVQNDGRIECRYSDGTVEADLNPVEAEAMASCWLGEPAPEAPAPAPAAKPRKPAKRASIALGRGWSIALRRDEVFPEDPGAGTPAVVCGPFGAQVTYWAAMDGMDADRDGEEIEIPASVRRAMDKAADEVDAYIAEVTAWLAREAR